jgi:hypothetical protein
MAISKNAKTKAGARRKKGPVRDEARRTARKARPIRKRVAKKAPIQPASPKKAKRTTKSAGKPPISERAPTAVRPSPNRTAQPTSSEQRIGVVLEPCATLRVGDVIHVRGNITEFIQKVESLEVNRAPVTEVGPDDNFGLKVVKHVFEHDVAFKVRS